MDAAKNLKKLKTIQECGLKINNGSTKSEEIKSYISDKINEIYDYPVCADDEKYLSKLKKYYPNITHEQIDEAMMFGLKNLFANEFKGELPHIIDRDFILAYKFRFFQNIKHMSKLKKTEKQAISFSKKSHLYSVKSIEKLFNSEIINIKSLNGEKYSDYFTQTDFIEICIKNNNATGKIDNILKNYIKLSKFDLSSFGIENKTGLDFFGKYKLIEICRQNINPENTILNILERYNDLQNYKVLIGSNKEENGLDFLGQSYGKELVIKNSKPLEQLEKIVEKYNILINTSKNINGEERNYLDFFGKYALLKIAIHYNNPLKYFEQIINKIEKLSLEKTNFNAKLRYNDIFTTKAISYTILKEGNPKKKLQELYIENISSNTKSNKKIRYK